jgi:hypothetical protein
MYQNKTGRIMLTEIFKLQECWMQGFGGVAWGKETTV